MMLTLVCIRRTRDVPLITGTAHRGRRRRLTRLQVDGPVHGIGETLIIDFGQSHIIQSAGVD